MTLHSSALGRAGHRDDRRRRLLAEERTGSADPSAQPATGAADRIGSPTPHKSANYGDAEFLETQLRPTDLVPRWLISYFLLLVLGAAAIGGLAALHQWVHEAPGAQHLQLALAELGSPGGLGNWLASLILLSASLLAAIVYSVRRHRVDDYHGRYHIWLWAAFCWFVMATDVAASLRQGFQQVMVWATATRILGDGSIWWVAPACLSIGAIVSRLLIDMWSSRLSAFALVLASGSYIVALVASYRGIVMPSETAQLLLVQCLALGGHLLLALSMGLHARHVILDAEGRLPRREPKKRSKAPSKTRWNPDSPAETAEAKDADSDGEADSSDEPNFSEEPADDDTWVAVDPPHGGPQPVLKRVAPAAPAAAPLARKIEALAGNSSSSTPTTSASGAESNLSKLSKADRKALKKKLLDERLKREQRKASNW
jgi:hypothetical protein